MKEFLIEHYVNITRLIEFIAAITGIIFYCKYKHTNVKYFIYFIVYILFVEIIGSYPIFIQEYNSFKWLFKYIEGTVFMRNYWWFQIFWTFVSTFFFLVFYKMNLLNTSLNKFIKYLIYVYSVLTILIIYFQWNSLKMGFLEDLEVVSFFIILFLVSAYFVQSLKSEQVLLFFKSFTFYASCGILLFSILTTPLTFFETYFNTSDWNYIILKWQVFLFANIFMYSLFIIGLIFSKPEYNSLLDN